MRVQVFLVFALACASRAQSTETPTTFEVASIKASPPADGRAFRVGCPSDPGRITCTNMTMSNLVQMAYGISHYQLANLETNMAERWEVAAKIPEGSTKEQIQTMWQNLLKDRFKLAVHFEDRQVPVYELSVAKGGLKIKESVETPPTPDAPPPPQANGPRKPLSLGDDGYPDIGPGGMAMMRNVARWRPVKITMDRVASMLAGQLGQPVTDVTGLTGKYDFTLSWFTGGGRGLAGDPIGSPIASVEDAPGPTLEQAVQSQLGLKLEHKKGTMKVLVIDHIEKTPTEN